MRKVERIKKVNVVTRKSKGLNSFKPKVKTKKKKEGV